MLFTAVGAVTLGALLTFLGEAFHSTGAFYTISAFLFASGAVLGSVSVATLIIQNIRSYWLESRVSANMVAVGPEDRIFESRSIGEAVVRSPVVGVTTQVVTLAPRSQVAPFVSRTPVYLTHLATELPVVEDLDEDAYQRLLASLKDNGHGNGKE